MRPIKRYELVELVIPALNTALRIPFPDIPQLRSDVTQDVIVRGLETYSAEAMPFDYNNNPVVTNAFLLKIFLTLYIQQEESIFRMPTVSLLNVVNAATAAAYFFTEEVDEFQDLMVDWTKSYITLASSLANAALICFMLGVRYQRLDGGTIANLQKRMNPANNKQTQSDWYNS